MSTITSDDLKVVSAHTIDSKYLLDFYKKAYPRKYEWMAMSWKWLYRVSTYEKFPLVMVKDHEVIGHFGAIPFKASLNKKEVNAAWFVDFALLEKYRGQRLGPILTKALMSEVDVAVTHCNEYSIKVFERLGWVKSEDSFLCFNFLFPHQYSKVRKFFPSFTRPVLNGVFKLFNSLCLTRISTKNMLVKRFDVKDVDEFISNGSKRNKGFHTLVDRPYLNWRFNESEISNQYFLFTYQGIDGAAILKFYKGEDRYIEILYSNTSEEDFIKLYQAIRKWAVVENYTYIKTFTSTPSIKKAVNKIPFTIQRNPIYAFFAEDKKYLKELSMCSHDWQTSDSDFEDFPRK